MIYLKSLIISKITPLIHREKFDEKDLSTQQSQAEKDPWISRKDEHQKRSKSLEKKKGKGEK